MPPIILHRADTYVCKMSKIRAHVSSNMYNIHVISRPVNASCKKKISQLDSHSCLQDPSLSKRKNKKLSCKK